MAEETRPFEKELAFTDPYKRTALFIKNGRADGAVSTSTRT